MKGERVLKDEGEYQKQVITNLTGFRIRTQVHNDRGYADVPDLSFAGCGIDGWIEIKYMPSGQMASPADIDHWTEGQRTWLEETGKAGSGFCFLWIGAPNDHIWVPYSLVNTSMWDGYRFKTVGAAAAAFRKYLESSR